MCYDPNMRQKFDVGDIVEYNNLLGLVVESRPIREEHDNRKFHVDEYRCKVRFFKHKDAQWVRAKWLKHISKISE